jgi:Potential Queuosine, Q, salvage protein family
MTQNLFSEIRAACRAVGERARHVRIAVDRIDAYAASLPLERAVAPTLDPNTHFLGNSCDMLAFFLTLDTINFGSGYFPHLKKRPGMSGYFTVASSLTDHYRAHGPIEPHRLTTMTADDCTTLFAQDAGNPTVRELMQLFSTALNDLGRFVVDRFGGQFTALVESANHSAARLLAILTEMKYFRDVERYGDIEIPFYKRAQLTAADLSLALNRTELGRFDDLDELTIFADNLVPHVLRIDRILEYTPELAARIDREELIPAGSEEEIEIRACAVHAVELMKQALVAKGKEVTSMGLDYVLWNRGQEKHYKSVKPRHRTRTIYY